MADTENEEDAIAVEEQPADDHDDNNSAAQSEKKKSQDKWRRIFQKLLFLPYFIGLVWTCLHPIVSVLTGELKCRGWYVDEHSIEIKFAEIKSWSAPGHLQIELPTRGQGLAKLCDVFSNHSATNLICHRHGDDFDLLSIVPLSNAVDPTDEAIVFVVPYPPEGDWTTSMFHYTLTHALRRLANPIDTPWLAKTLILVAPTSAESSLDDVISKFLDASLGSIRSSSTTVAPLPPKLSGALLRTLVVIDVEDKSRRIPGRKPTQDQLTGRTEFSILPQGRRGVLPNMDLVFLIGRLFERSMLLNTRKYPGSTFLAHGYTQEAKQAKNCVEVLSKELSLDAKTKVWAEEMANLGLFAYSMAMGPYPPHAPALDRGIDSITIQARFEGIYWRDPSVEMIQYVEYLVRALSNLHERLHHSFTLYLLPSPKKFVSHVEYFLPTILLLLPLAVRVFGLILFEIDRLHLATIGCALLVALVSMGVMLVSSLFGSDATATNTWLFGLYVMTATVWKTKLLQGKKEDEHRRILQTLQFVACTFAVYIHVPIVFAHASLAYFPCMLWTALLAFPNYGSDAKGSQAFAVLGAILCLLSAPPVLLVPRIFDSYTTFVRFGYVPLHVQLLLLVLTRLLR